MFDETVGTPEEIVEDDTLFFMDGNIVILSAPTEGRVVAFKVYQGILARYATVFRDMFSAPGPRSMSAEELYNGCPFVRVTETGEEIGGLLHAIFDRK